MQRLVCLVLVSWLLGIMGVSQGKSITYYDVELFFGHPEDLPSFGNTALNDVHPTTYEWVGGTQATNGGGGLVFNNGTETFLQCPQSPALTAQGINTARSIVGSCLHNGILVGYHATVANAFTLVQPPESTQTYLNGVNDADKAVGFYQHGTTQGWKPLIWDKATKKTSTATLPLAGVTSAIFHSINNAGWTTGILSVANGPWQGFMFNLTTKNFWLLNAPGALETYPLDLDDKGRAVGIYIDADFVSHSFIWQGSTGGGWFTIRLPGTLGYILTSIANNSRLAGNAWKWDADAQTIQVHSFIAKAIPWERIVTPHVAVAAIGSTRSLMTVGLVSSGAPLCQQTAPLPGKLQPLRTATCDK